MVGDTLGTPNHPDLAGGYPSYCPPTHHTGLGWGTSPPSKPGWGVPRVPPTHHPDLGWRTPSPSRSGMGHPPTIRPDMGYPPLSDLGWGTPHQTWLGYPPSPTTIQTWTGYPPPTTVNRQTPVKTVSSRRTTYAGGDFWFIEMMHTFYPSSFSCCSN